MASYGDGVIEIPLEEFWSFVHVYCDNKKSEVFYGVPRVNNDNQTMEIDYLFNSSINPQEQCNFEDSKPCKQWEELKNK